MIGILLTVLLLIFLVGASAFFSSSETAILSLSKISLRQMVKENIPGAKKVVTLKNDMDRLLTTILIGNNFVNNLASSAATALAVSLFGQNGVGAATIVMTVVIILFGEILPKTIATYKSQSIACGASSPLAVLQKLMFPIVWLFARLTKAVGFILDKIWKNHDMPLVTEEELKTLFAVGSAEGTLEDSEKDMLYKIFEFTDLRVRDISRHRSFVQSVPSDASYEQAASVFSKTGYSRLPVYDTAVKGDGTKDEYIGLLHYKTLLFFHGDTKEKDFARRYMRPVLFVPESKPALSLLHVFRNEKANFAVVVDEYGSNRGIVTMDDILNAVMGHIIDEYTSEIPPEQRIKILSATEFLVPGDLKINDVNGIFKLQCESEDFDTLGGWLMEQFGYLPSDGEKLRHGSCEFTVEDQSQRRIQMVRVKFLP